MPVSVEFQPGTGILVQTWSGAISDTEYADAMDGLLAAWRGYGAVRGFLSDWCDVERIGVRTSTFREVARRAVDGARRVGFTGRIAMAAPTDASYGLARMWEALADGGPWEATRAFRDRDEALQWLADHAP